MERIHLAPSLTVFFGLLEERVRRGNIVWFCEEDGHPCVIILNGPSYHSRVCRATGRRFDEVLPKALSMLHTRQEGATMPGPVLWEHSCDLDNYVQPGPHDTRGRSVFVWSDGDYYRASAALPSDNEVQKPLRRSDPASKRFLYNAAEDAVRVFLLAEGVEAITDARNQCEWEKQQKREARRERAKKRKLEEGDPVV